MHSFLQLCILIPLNFFFFWLLIANVLGRAAAQLPVSPTNGAQQAYKCASHGDKCSISTGGAGGCSVLFYQVQVQLGAVSFKNKLVSLG